MVTLYGHLKTLNQFYVYLPLPYLLTQKFNIFTKKHF